ncbi:MAG: TA system VapC family ribonuclease toxin [bacterium]|jgi:hypothetical protein|nr:PIN domain-containing protein [Betaproteobacteria bacterium]
MTPDVNVLLAALRADHPQHQVARRWLEDALTEAASGASFTLMPVVVASMLRLATSPRIFQVPTPIDAAVGFIDALVASSGVTMAQQGPEWPVLRRLCMDKRLGGNDLPDAWLAASTLHLGEHLVSFDRDFRKLLGRAHFTLLSSTTG